MNVFFVIPDDKVRLYRTAVKLITQQCLDYFSTRSTNVQSTILFALDEYSTFNIDLSDALNKYRKRKVRIMALTQSLMQIDLAVGELKRKTYLDNFQTKILLNVSEPDSQEYFSRLIGKHEIVRHTRTESSNDISNSRTESREYIIQPDYLGQMTDSLILINKNGFNELLKYKESPWLVTYFRYMKLALNKWLLRRQ